MTPECPTTTIAVSVGREDVSMSVVHQKNDATSDLVPRTIPYLDRPGRDMAVWTRASEPVN
jgi:hypothetical protein